jgi:hypothetical protein
MRFVIAYGLLTVLVVVGAGLSVWLWRRHQAEQRRIWGRRHH